MSKKGKAEHVAMSREAPVFKKADLTRALEGARDAGLEVGRIEINMAGKIVLFARISASHPISALDRVAR